MPDEGGLSIPATEEIARLQARVNALEQLLAQATGGADNTAHQQFEARVRERATELEEARRHIDERLHFQANVLAQVNDAVVGIDNNYRVNYWNGCAETLYGIPAAAAIGQPLSDLYTTRWYTPEAERAAYTALELTGLWRGEVIHVTRRGQELDIEASTSVVRDMHDTKIGLLAVIRDVTERRRMENALRTSQAQFQQLIDNLSAGIYIKDKQGRFLFVNILCARIFHLKPEEMVGKTDYALMPAHLADVISTNDQRILATGVTEEVEEITLLDDGLHTYISAKFPLRDANGQIYALCGISTDITERMRAEDALRQSETALRNVVLHAPFPISVHAEDGEILYLSKIWSDLTGYAREDIPTIAAWTERAFGASRATVQAAIQRLYEARTTIEAGEYTITTATGQKRVWEFSGTGLGKLADGRRAAVSMAVDVTERSRLYRDTRKALEAEKSLNDLKDLFLSSASHELRTPLTAIQGYAQILQRNRRKRGDAPDRDDALLASVVQQTNRMNKLVSEIFDVSQLQTGQFVITPSPGVDLVALLQRMVAQAQVTSPDRDFAFSTDEQPAIATVDEERIEQVIHNLIANALKYSPKGVPISIGITAPTPVEAVLWVRDYGRGIDPEDQPHVFNRFYRAQTNPGVQGLGLGLYISHEIITRHKGRMWLDSAIGFGSTFYVALPLHED